MQITVILIQVMLLGYINCGVVVNFDDNKSSAIRQPFQYYLNNDMDGLKSFQSPELYVQNAPENATLRIFNVVGK